MSNQSPDDLLSAFLETISSTEPRSKDDSNTSQNYQTPIEGTANDEEMNFSPEWCPQFESDDSQTAQLTTRREDLLAVDEIPKQRPSRPKRHLSIVAPDRYKYNGASSAPLPAVAARLLKTDIFILEKLATDIYTPTVFLEHLADHPDADLRAALAENKSTPSGVIEKLARDEDVNVRYQLAENHNISKSVLLTLTQDENPYVACRAKQTLNRLL